MSTKTEPGFAEATISLVTSLGARAPGISTEPMTRSARNRVADHNEADATVDTPPLNSESS